MVESSSYLITNLNKRESKGNGAVVKKEGHLRSIPHFDSPRGR